MEERRSTNHPATAGLTRFLQKHVTPTYDFLDRHYEGEPARRVLTAVVVLLFVGGILAAELMRQGIGFPQREVTHFVAVELVFTWLLAVEVVGLVMGIVGSVANAMGKQIEILSLILLRDAFKQFTHFSEPIGWAQVEPYILQILADIGGGLILFVILGIYYRIQRHRPITSDPAARDSFIAVKKLVALTMLVVFVLVGLGDVVRLLMGLETYPFFETFYTILIFSDIFVVLISLRYTSTYAVVFRNSGYTLTTVLIRLTLTAPRYLDVALGVAAGILALGLSWAYHFFPPIPPRDDIRGAHEGAHRSS